MRYDDLSGEGFELFGEIGDGGYEWEEFAVWIKDGVFYWASDAGCSCNGPWDFGIEFEGSGTKHQAITALFAWAGGPAGAARAGESLLVKLLNYKEPK